MLVERLVVALAAAAVAVANTVRAGAEDAETAKAEAARVALEVATGMDRSLRSQCNVRTRHTPTPGRHHRTHCRSYTSRYLRKLWPHVAKAMVVAAARC
jgi:hypothetical protein